MVDETGEAAAAKAALKQIVEPIARRSARAAAQMKVDFDVDDPRVARWLMLVSFESFFSEGARSTTAALLRQAEEASRGECRRAPQGPGKGKRKAVRPLVTWADLVASVPDYAQGAGD